MRQGEAMNRRIALWIACLFASGAASGQQGERITSFHSDITVHTDGNMTVRETIKVIALGQQIHRGIFRDFPTSYRDLRGNRVRVGFDIVGVVRDGGEEHYHTERMRNGVRIYFGHEAYYIPQGEHTYEFTYRTTHQLGFFDDHDELYWNVTGNAWAFPILRASADVTLPEGIDAAEISAEGYTGLQGERGLDLDAEVDAPSHASFYTTRALDQGEGLTIVVSFPKGVVQEPTATARVAFFVHSNRGDLLILGGGLLVLAFYVAAWVVVGKDPPKGRVLPRESPPEGVSPAAARYLRRMGADAKTFSVALMSMATKGYLQIDEDERNRDFSILRGKGKDDVLSEDELAVARELFKGGERIDLVESNHQVVGRAKDALTDSLAERYKGSHFNRHGQLIAVGMLGSAAAVAGGAALAGGISWSVIAGAIALVVINIVFAILLKAPTSRGRRVLDEIDGFEMYLEGAGTNRLSAQSSADETAKRFEQFLPFAIALNTESKWVDEFTAALNQSPEPMRSYRPDWYHGPHWTPHMPAAFPVSLLAGFSGAVASASTPPGSSSGGGGGGSSGGGGGGGGGGGW